MVQKNFRFQIFLTLTLLVLGFSCSDETTFFTGPTGFVEVTVLDGDGEPIEGATVWIPQAGFLVRSLAPAAPIALIDTDEEECDDPTTPFSSADCTDGDGLAAVGCSPNVPNTIAVSNGGAITTVNDFCNGEAVEITAAAAPTPTPTPTP